MRKFLIIALIAILLLLNMTDVADRAGDRYFDEALKNAAVTFAVARVLNGMISVIQHIEVAATPAGIGLSAAPGQILDPLNVLVEQFSTVMLLATVSLAIQKLLLSFSGWWGAKLVISGLLGLTVLLLALDYFTFARRLDKRFFYKFVLLVLFVRFTLPFVAISSGIIEGLFLNGPIRAKTGNLQLVEQSAAAAIEADEDSKWHESLLTSGKNLVQLKENATLLKEKLTKSIGTIVDLIALFIIQTILLPLGSLYLAVKLIKYLFAYELSRPHAAPHPQAGIL